MSSPAATPEIAVLIGRFQPFHNGHVTLLKAALDTAPRVVVILGSSFHARSPKNPFTWQERAAMISASLSEADCARIAFVPLRDYYEDSRWAHAVQAAVATVAEGARRIALVGHFKDESSYYLNHFPQWQLIAIQKEEAIDATSIRHILLEAEELDVSLAAITQLVPLAIRQYLRAWAKLPCYAGLAQEHRIVEQEKARWRSAPYPPVFVTVDAVVRAGGHVLLIRRGGYPAKGLWAMPGGFLEQRERLVQGALRELGEETRLAVLESTMLAALVDVAVFDYPDRSARGRTITHAHYFDLDTAHLPDAQASDDAAQVAWVPIDKLLSMEEQFCEDHFHILNHFLKLTAD